MNLLILGGNSDVAYAVARIYAEKEQANIILASRNMELLNKKVSDLKIRTSANIQAFHFDALDNASHASFYNSLNPKPDVVVLAFGYLGDQVEAQNDFAQAKKIIDSNYTGAVSILEIIASDFEKRGHGSIIGISSVAGDRGRQSNYMYGSAKGALTIYLGGLRNRLSKKNVHVVTVLPGFIDTKMTENMELPGKLTASPDQVARDIYNAYKKNRNIIYTRWFFRWIMVIIKSIPEIIFKKLNL